MSLEQKLIDDGLRLKALENFLDEVQCAFSYSTRYEYSIMRMYPSLYVVGFSVDLGLNSFDVDIKNLDSIINATVKFRAWMKEEDERVKRIG